MKWNRIIGLAFVLGTMVSKAQVQHQKQPVDYVNPYIGNISHLLVPTFPTVHLPNSMMRMIPERADFTGDVLNGLPLLLTSHRGATAFNLSVYQGNALGNKAIIPFHYDQEVVKPYYYSVMVEEQGTQIRFAPSHQSAIYEIGFVKDQPSYLIFNTAAGSFTSKGNSLSGYQRLKHNCKVYIYVESDHVPRQLASDSNVVKWYFGDKAQTVKLRYGISFISEAQAAANLKREINHFDLDQVAGIGRNVWNQTLGKIRVKDSNENNQTVFYTALYRTAERPVNISEDGRYFSASDMQVHQDQGQPFYTDDWIWDTYRATHPLRLITEPKLEAQILQSYLTMAGQMPHFWMPTFPEVTGDSRRMNSNHGVAIFADAWAKGQRGFDLNKAFEASRKGIEEKSLAPWSDKPAGWLDQFFKDSGYIPGLHEDEKETVPEVNAREQRQTIAVTLGTSYDLWCLSQLAKAAGDEASYQKYLGKSYQYQKVFNPQTGFFHPKDKDGKFIEPFDYRSSGGRSAYYGENNGWTYRWDLQHNIADLIRLMGGNQAFCHALDSMFAEPLGKGKSTFYRSFPDQTGNVGQFTMANEPSFHIPYLYNYAGQPWKTQKRIRTLLAQWFRNDLMGMPGDEDGGGMSAFVVFSSMGFYPVTPGIPAYSIGSPLFEQVSIQTPNGKVFEIVAKGCSKENKYVQGAILNGKAINRTWIFHEEMIHGGKLELTMGSKPNYQWGTAPLDKQLSAAALK